MTNSMFILYTLPLLWLKSTCVFSKDQCDLEVTNLYQERKLECVEYKKVPGCRAGERVQVIPDNLHLSVEKPATLFATSAMRQSSDGWYPFLNITWTPPKSAMSLKNLKGFLLRLWTSYPDPHNYCRIFLIEDGLLPHDKEAVFKKIVHPVLEATTYFIVIWSLPRSGENFELAQTLQVTTPSTNQDYDYDPHSSSTWTTSVTFRVVNDNEVHVTFDFGTFGIDKFQVGLMKEDLMNSGDYSYSKTVFKSKSKDPNHGKVSFKDVETGTYRVQVTPLDTFKNDPQHCLCFTMSDGDRLCGSCSTSQTLPFNVTSNGKGGTSKEMKTTSTPAISGFVEGKELSEESLAPKRKTKNSEGLIVIVLALFVCVIVFGSVSILIWKAHQNRAGQNTGNPAAEIGTMSQESADNRKSILVLCADDHYRHLEVVKDLLNILNQFCGFNVIYPPKHIDQICRINWKNWIVQCVDNVDFVLLIASEAAAKLVSASLKRETYNVEHLTETGHLFVPMLRQVLKASNKELTLDRYITVSFSYTPIEFSLIPGLPTPHNFILVEGLREFMCCMKNLSGSSVTATASDENHLTNLRYSVLRAARYELCHVNWFSERFGDPYPRSYNRLDSGYHSVAPPRINDISESSSPENQLEKEDQTDELGFYPPEEECERVVFYNIPPDDFNADCMSLSVSTQLRKINDNYENSAH